MDLIQKKRLKNLSIEELKKIIEELGEKPYRITQLLKWVYLKRVDSFSEMTDLPKSLRDLLDNTFILSKLKRESVLVSKKKDAVKFTFELIESPSVVECVLLYDDKRRTACLSSQLGCGLGCCFCATGKMGFVRNLSLEEIIGQLIGINDYLASQNDKLVTNIVFMGMGEALSNFENLMSALQIIMNEDAFNIGGRRITISTAGVIPSIRRLMEQDLNVGLAISLNSIDNEERSRLMPINKVYPIEQLIEIAKEYFEKTGRRVTFEYVVRKGENDTEEAAGRLEKYLSGFPCKINLIPLNPIDNSTKKIKPSEKDILKFADELHRRGLSATIRKSRGEDIFGACGQLAGRELRREGLGK
ncbi:MAG: 23S rRNA (adenine(2503)-C(2))-methyltransferase RlmN [Chitinispirillaceae bacterium]|nr:23S rRNA (adenine(2503)-C(2))-methyltransferase RlmN [Chitinispirillaceae bacterium]